jgi:hypothetical protein
MAMVSTFVKKVQNLSLRDSRVLCLYEVRNNFATSIGNGTTLTVCQWINGTILTVCQWINGTILTVCLWINGTKLTVCQ